MRLNFTMCDESELAEAVRILAGVIDRIGKGDYGIVLLSGDKVSGSDHYQTFRRREMEKHTFSIPNE
jgi:hypothetical protein